MSELFANNIPKDLPQAVNKLELIRENDGRWKTKDRLGGKFTAKGLHIFVVQQGRLVLSPRKSLTGGRPVSHVDLAHGKEVEFAGEIVFGQGNRKGILEYWNDKTGHYHDGNRSMNPDVVRILPPDRFVRYEDER
ncbi:MAG: hypothetical protein ACHRXM_06020 [Isosphaerales bacterium]